MACDKWGVDIVGGDTTSSLTGLAISITCIGEAAKEDIVYRSGAKETDLIIGTSMGGMYTEMLYGTDRILVNPAFQMGETMGKHGMIGKQTFQNPRKDGVQEFIVTKAMVAGLITVKVDFLFNAKSSLFKGAFQIKAQVSTTLRTSIAGTTATSTLAAEEHIKNILHTAATKAAKATAKGIATGATTLLGLLKGIRT